MHLGIIGYGSIASTLIRLLEAAPVRRITLLVRPSALTRAGDELASCHGTGSRDITADPAELISARPDLIVECAGGSAVRDLAPQVLRAGIPLIVASVGALADAGLAAELRHAVIEGGTRLLLPSGAIGGIDLLAALVPAGGLTVTYRGIKPPAAWKGTLAEDLLDLDALSGPTVFFSGTARDAALSYPKNANVVATLALAGAGLDATRAELVADPAADGNQHSYQVVSPLCRFSVDIENSPSPGNAKTSLVTVYSLLREINRFRNPIAI